MHFRGGADLRVKRIIFGANAAAVNLINPRDRYADIAKPGSDAKVPRLSFRNPPRIINTISDSEINRIIGDRAAQIDDRDFQRWRGAARRDVCEERRYSVAGTRFVFLSAGLARRRTDDDDVRKRRGSPFRDSGPSAIGVT